LLAAVLGLAAGACGRSPLDLAYQPVSLPIVDAGAAVDLRAEPVADVPPELAPDVPPDVPPDLAPDLPRDLPPEAKPDATPDLPREAAPAERPPVEAGPVCQPQPETCNGLDDNCDGRVDEDQPAIPCPNGGSRYCVGGRYSECPRRCEVCIPGSERECFTSFCLYWGTQFCASDGRSFGTCKETTPPAACRAIADKHRKSPELEQCCIDQGFCCLDDFDLDNDGDTKDMVGRCDTVMCGQ
jgi:hypothetical protein